MKQLTVAAILIGVALVGTGTALADGLDCNGRLRCKACSVVVPGLFRDTVTGRRHVDTANMRSSCSV